MRKNTEIFTRVIFEEKCPHCQRIIKGTTEKSVQWNLQTHIREKHAETRS